ncbi:MAG: YciI family protein [Polyangiales bacterium]
MQYLLMIYDNEKDWASMTEAKRGALYQAYGKFTKEIEASGNLQGGNPLQPTSTATTVRKRDGKVLKTDGPFAETREQLGGYYLIEAKDLDEACAIAARIPSAEFGSIEVRPIQPMSM